MSKREWLGWFCLWGILVALLIHPNEAKAREIVTPIFSDAKYAHLDTVQLLATNLYHEARNQSDLANMAILAVVERRKQLSGRFVAEEYGATYEGAIFKPHAFAWTDNLSIGVMGEEEQYERLYKLTERFLSNKQVYMELAQGADHYVKVGHVTKWDYSKLEFLFQIDEHLFYRHK